MGSDRRLSRIAGVLYLLVAICGAFSELYVRTTVDAGGAAATAENIAGSETLFRFGALTDLVQVAGFLMVGLILFWVLERAGRRAALTMLTFVAVSVAVMTANMVNHFGALQAATSGSAAQAELFLDLHGYGYLMAGVFFGLWLLPLGILIVRSGAAPSWLGVLLMVGAFGYVADVVANTLFAAPGEALAPVLAIPAAVAEITFAVWLLVKGLVVPADPGRADVSSGRVAAAV